MGAQARSSRNALRKSRRRRRGPTETEVRAHLSRATCGRILARVREVYGYEKPQPGDGTKRTMPFAATRRHEVWNGEQHEVVRPEERIFGEPATEEGFS